MNKKTLVMSALAVLAIIGTIWLGRPGANGQASVVSQNTRHINFLSAEEKIFDFGIISMKNGNVDHLFKVTNSSGNNIEIKSISTSCMCTSAYLEIANGEKGPFGMEGMGHIPPVNQTVKPGESFEIKAVYDPNAHGPAGVGAIDRLIYLTDASGETLQLEIKAVVTP